MKLEHVGLYVHDLERAKAFFLTYFDASSSQVYHNPQTRFRSYFLSFRDGSRLEIMTRPDLSDTQISSNRYGYAHIAFCTGSREAVDALTDRMRNDGYSVLSGPRTTGDGYYESCILDFEGNVIEITI